MSKRRISSGRLLSVSISWILLYLQFGQIQAVPLDHLIDEHHGNYTEAVTQNNLTKSLDASNYAREMSCG